MWKREFVASAHVLKVITRNVDREGPKLCDPSPIQFGEAFRLYSVWRSIMACLILRVFDHALNGLTLLLCLNRWSDVSMTLATSCGLYVSWQLRKHWTQIQNVDCLEIGACGLHREFSWWALRRRWFLDNFDGRWIFAVNAVEVQCDVTWYVFPVMVFSAKLCVGWNFIKGLFRHSIRQWVSWSPYSRNYEHHILSSHFFEVTIKTY
jgi:hypothetical protein